MYNSNTLVSLDEYNVTTSSTTTTTNTTGSATSTTTNIVSTCMNISAQSSVINASYNEEWNVNITDVIPRIAVTFVVSVLALITILGNIFVIVAFKIDRKLQILSHYFLLSLAVADTSIGIVSIPFYTVFYFFEFWPLGREVCDMWLVVDYTMCNASVANLLVICVDRYFSISRPLTYRANRTPVKVGIMIACAWIVSILLWTPWIIAWPYIEGQRTVPENDCYIQFLATNPSITMITSLCAFYTPVTIMIVLYFKIYRKTSIRNRLFNVQGSDFQKSYSRRSEYRYNATSVRSQSNEGLDKTKTDEGTCSIFACFRNCVDQDYDADDQIRCSVTNISNISDDESTNLPTIEKLVERKIVQNFETVPRNSSARNVRSARRRLGSGSHRNAYVQRQERKAARTLSVILLVFIITWTPYNVLAVLSPLCPSCVNGTAWSFAYWLCYLNSTVNPFCYALCNANFRRAFFNILRCNCASYKKKK
ncbi:ACM2-like protein [Mya arenaria]|uniref:ACM2-like protein n=1 Tax=Mya arenaria TaxID=6604 RepID=A0ABY7F8E2_MYAAR|nr:ACM2-like protein [Mya arenaria]